MANKPEDIAMSEAEFGKQFQSASKRGRERLAELPKAAAARYDKASNRMVFEMQNGVTLLVPTSLIQGLQDADDDELMDFQLVGEGSQIHWDKADVQFYIEDLIKGAFGTPKWMKSLQEQLSEIGRKGGSATSKRKSVSSRANGAKGGRPARRTA